MGGAHPPAQRAVIGLLSRHSPAEKTMSRKAALRPWGRQAVPDGRERRGWPRGPRHEERRKGLVSRRQKDRGTRRFKVTDGSRGLRLFQSRVLNNYSMKILRQKKQKITTSASFSDEHTAWGRRRRRRAAPSVKHATQTSARPQSKRPEPGPSTRGNGGQRHREPAPQSSRRNTGGRNPGDSACPESGRRGGRAQPSRTGNLPQCARTASPARRHRRFCTGQEPAPGRRLPPGDPPQLRRRADSSRGRPGEAALTPAETSRRKG